MSAALALSQSVSVTTTSQAKRPALNLVQVAKQPAALAQKLRKRAAVRNRLGAMMESATSMALFHAYRP